MTIFLRSFLTFWIATVVTISITFGPGPDDASSQSGAACLRASPGSPGLSANDYPSAKYRQIYAGGGSMPDRVHPGPIQD